jgi:DNA processing protein
MIRELSLEIAELKSMSKVPDRLFYLGNKELLQKPKVSIVGTRRPSSYTKDWTYKLAKELAKRGVVVVSGAAMGVDAIAHMGAKAENTVAVVANGLDIRYPAVNKNLISDIEQRGLVISFFEPGFRATKWSFVKRNELVVALGEVLIVTEADLNSGSLRSVEYALKMGKEIYVLPHRLNESLGTNDLLKDGKAEAIYSIEEFANRFGKIEDKKDEFTLFLEKSPTLNEALVKFGDKIYEAELEGLIAIENGYVKLL